MTASSPSGDRLRAALEACRRHFVYAGLFSALLNLLFIVPMLYMLQVYDRVVPTNGGTTLLFLTLVLLLGLAVLSLLDWARSRILVRAGIRIDRLLSHAVIETTMMGPQQGAQGLAKQALREFDTFRQALSGPTVLALFDAPWTPIYILICFIIHPWIGALALVGGFLLLAIAWRSETVTRDPLKRAGEAAGRAYLSHEFSAAAADVARALGIREALVARHLRDRAEMTSLQSRASLASSGLVAASKFLRLLLQSLSLGLGALLAIGGHISAGAIFAAMFMLGRALAPIDQLVGNWRSFVLARAAYATLEELVSRNDGRAERTLLPRPQGRLDVEELSVLDPAGRPILESINFSVKQGEVVAIIGPSGAGKSTLVRAIAGAILPASGAIRFDQADRQDWDPERLARFVGFMPQGSSLFAGTVKENIARFETGPEADEAAVEAARLAGAHELILRLPGGYDYELQLGGQGLSAGQAQRITLARALYRNPGYVLLDEPNANLDTEGDAQLIETLKELKRREVTVLIVAHRPSILPIANRIIVIRDGRLAMDGERDEVLAQLRGPAAPSVTVRRVQS